MKILVKNPGNFRQPGPGSQHGRQNPPSQPARLDANAKSKMQSDVTAQQRSRKPEKKIKNYNSKLQTQN